MKLIYAASLLILSDYNKAQLLPHFFVSSRLESYARIFFSGCLIQIHFILGYCANHSSWLHKRISIQLDLSYIVKYFNYSY